MITKLQESSIEKIAGGVALEEYPGLIPDGVLAMLLAGPAGEHSPIFRA